MQLVSTLMDPSITQKNYNFREEVEALISIFNKETENQQSHLQCDGTTPNAAFKPLLTTVCSWSRHSWIPLSINCSAQKQSRLVRDCINNEHTSVNRLRRRFGFVCGTVAIRLSINGMRWRIVCRKMGKVNVKDGKKTSKSHRHTTEWQPHERMCYE